MKAVVVSALTFLMALLPLQAGVVLVDAFNYPDGSLVGAPNSPWETHSGTPQQTQVANGAIRVTFANTEDVNALLSGGPYTTSGSETLYASFKVRFSALPTLSGSYFAHFKDTNTGPATGFGGRLFAATTNAASGMFRLSIGNGSLANPTNAQFPLDLSTNTTYTVVSRFVPSSGVATLWINPTAETDLSVTATDEGTVTRPNPIDVVAYAFRQANGIGTMLVDDLRVGTSFTDVAGANNPPSISNIPGQSTGAGVALGPIPFTIGDAETPAGSLTLARNSTNATVIPVSNIVFGGSGSNRTVTLTPAPGAQGRSAVTITVSDGTSQASITFLVSVGFPAISSIADQQTPVNTSTAPISFTIGDAETPVDSLALNGFSSNPSLVPEGTIIFGGSGPTRTVMVTPALDATGIATITISVSDGEVTAEETFVLTVYPELGMVKSDDFNRPDGSLSGDGVWFTHSGTVLETQITNNQVRLSGSQSEDVSTELGGAPYSPAGGYILYTSFAVRFTQLPSASGGYFAHFKDDANGFRGRVYASTGNAAPGRYRLGIANNAASINANAEWPADLSLDTTYTVVTRYNVATGVSTLWVDPASEATPGTVAVDNPSTINVWYYALRQTGGIGTLWVDDLKVGGSFRSVFTPKPPVAVARVGNSIEISWPAAADGFNLQSTATLDSWAAVTEQPAVVGDRKVVTLSNPTGIRFFRLSNE